MVSHIACVYSEDHIGLSMADYKIAASTSARVVHTPFIATSSGFSLRHKIVVSHGVVVVVLPKFSSSIMVRVRGGRISRSRPIVH